MVSDNKPLLTIITRCCKRPNMLRKNVDSVYAQTCQDLEQIYIVDSVGRGLRWANEQFHANRNRVDGDYVMMLDDDCLLKDAALVSKLHALVSLENPDVVIMRSTRPKGFAPRVVPPDDVFYWFGDKPPRWSGNANCYIVKAKLWRRFTREYFTGRGGDWHFMNRILHEPDVTFRRLEITAAGMQQRGYGNKFEPVIATSWFEDVVVPFGAKDYGKDDWRLKLWQTSHS